ncbi:MAG: hypothetical protein K8R74_09375 [Bacteroidales bacterium]|nr:hypothetical protein [Bacteroidales bacterium]
MNYFFNILFLSLLPYLISAQTLTPKVFGSAGGLMEGDNGSLSMTIGEGITGTFSDGTYYLTQGFQQPIDVVLEGLTYDFQVFLEGPYTGSIMSNHLSAAEKIPLSQPYSGPPWNYYGCETVVSLPNAAIVDWVLVEIRQASNAQHAFASTATCRQAAFLLNDGSIVGLDGLSKLKLNLVPDDFLFAVIWHRNHLGIMSANALTQIDNVYSYDFTNEVNQVYGGNFGYKITDTGVCVMVAGDGNHDGIISNLDKNLWKTEVGFWGYFYSDYNMDSQVNNNDQNEFWLNNTDYSSQVPQ